jgi:hypothetical protein
MWEKIYDLGYTIHNSSNKEVKQNRSSDNVNSDKKKNKLTVNEVRCSGKEEEDHRLNINKVVIIR